MRTLSCHLAPVITKSRVTGTLEELLLGHLSWGTGKQGPAGQEDDLHVLAHPWVQVLSDVPSRDPHVLAALPLATEHLGLVNKDRILDGGRKAVSRAVRSWARPAPGSVLGITGWEVAVGQGWHLPAWQVLAGRKHWITEKQIRKGAAQGPSLVMTIPGAAQWRPQDGEDLQVLSYVIPGGWL